jgi:large subunit ribosomal protein L24
MSNRSQAKLYGLARRFLRKSRHKRQIKNNIKPLTKWNIVRGDHVEIIEGQDVGKRGYVSKVVRSQNRVIVDGLKLRKRHVSGNQERAGTIKHVESLIHVSNVMLIDPESGKRTKVTREFLDGDKVRVSKRSGAIIPKPEILKLEGQSNKTVNALCDTLPDDVFEVTYVPPDYTNLEALVMPEEAKMPGRYPGRFNLRQEVLEGRANAKIWPFAEQFRAQAQEEGWEIKDHGKARGLGTQEAQTQSV